MHLGAALKQKCTILSVLDFSQQDEIECIYYVFI